MLLNQLVGAEQQRIAHKADTSDFKLFVRVTRLLTDSVELQSVLFPMNDTATFQAAQTVELLDNERRPIHLVQERTHPLARRRTDIRVSHLVGAILNESLERVDS